MGVSTLTKICRIKNVIRINCVYYILSKAVFSCPMRDFRIMRTFHPNAINDCPLFNSPEPNAQVSHCHPFSSVICRPSSVVRRELTFYIFIFFSRTGGRISTKIVGDHPKGEGTQSCSYGADGLTGAQGRGPQG